MTSEGEGVLNVVSHNVSWQPECFPLTSSQKNKINGCNDEKIISMLNSSCISTSKSSSPTHMDEDPSSNQKRRSLRYDSADSSDSGVGGDSLVWSPCSSLLSYSPPPVLSDLDDDLPSDGASPPSPPQSSPSSPTEDVHVTRIPPIEGDPELPFPYHRDSHSPLKDRPPDGVSSRTRRKSSGLAASPRLTRKRGYDVPPTSDGPQDGLSGPPRCNGQVTTEPALLARLSGLSDREERAPTRSSPRGKEKVALGAVGGHGPRNGHVNGLRRAQQQEEGVRLKESRTQQEQLQLLRGLKGGSTPLNNNTSEENDRCLPQRESLSSLVASFPPSASSFSSCSSGLGSSLSSDTPTPTPSSSGTSTPTLSSSPPAKAGLKVRFPAPEKKEPGDACRWHGCGALLDQSSSLLEHIQAVHVEGQLEAESFRCLWVGCKVFDRASCSVSWLERHVLTHGGHKPFKCIVDGCGHRFKSQTALGRHVNHHFSSPSAAPTPRPQNQSSPVKLLRKNGRKLRYRKRPWSETQGKTITPRVFDFFDLSTMEKVRWGLMCALQSQPEENTPSNCVTFQSQVLCKRKNLRGDSELLVRWSPHEILPDEWVKTEDFEKTRSVPFHKLDHQGQLLASSQICPSFSRQSSHKRKRSPHRRRSAMGVQGLV